MNKNYHMYKNELIVELGNVLKELRTSSGMTQSELAKKVGMSRNTISNIEVGLHSITISRADKILTVLGYDTASDILMNRIYERYPALVGDRDMPLNDIASFISLASESAGVTQKSRAEKMLISRQLLYYIRRGKNNLKLTTVNCLFETIELEDATTILCKHLLAQKAQRKLVSRCAI